jgi:putative aldouronate transport system permease protein
VKIESTPARKVFLASNYLFITLVTLSCALPLLNVLAMSFSSSAFVDAGLVGMFPRGFTLAPYRYVLNNGKFWAAFGVTFRRLAIGVPVNLILSVLMAYPLSKEERRFPARKVYIWFFLICMIFNGGLVPTYLLVRNLGLIDTIWALVLPSGMNVFSSVILMNFFRGIPKEIEESALLDGAGHLSIMLKLYLPLSAPCIATITLFAFMGHWNAWMDGRIYMNFTQNYPLQTYLQSVIIGADNIMLSSLTGGSNLETMADMMAVNSRNLRASQIFISIIPVMLVYPFLQKYFTTGLVMGSVKG